MTYCDKWSLAGKPGERDPYGSSLTESTRKVRSRCRYKGKRVSGMRSYSPRLSQQRAFFKELIYCNLPPWVPLKDKEWIPRILREGILGVQLLHQGGQSHSSMVCENVRENSTIGKGGSMNIKPFEQQQLCDGTALWKTKTTFVSCSGTGCQQSDNPLRQPWLPAQTLRGHGLPKHHLEK